MKFVGMMKIITGTNENRGIWISKITIFSKKWFEGGITFLFLVCVDSRQATFLFVLPASFYNGIHWTMVSGSCLIMSFFCLFLATRIFPTIILPRKWGQGLKTESSYVAFCCGCCFLHIRYTELNNNTLSVFHELKKEPAQVTFNNS